MSVMEDRGVAPGVMYDALGSTYAWTRTADRTLVSELVRLLAPSMDGVYLDLGCGTGSYTAALADIAGGWHGLDRSEVMLRQARARAPRIAWRIGCAERMPYEDETFDGIVCLNAIHFMQLGETLGELRRVLRSRGRLVIFTMFSEQLERYWLREYFPRMMAAAAASMPRASALLAALADAGFQASVSHYHVTRDLTDLFLYCGKERPELYFDPNVRRNISQFARFCSEDELASGLRRLERDMRERSFPPPGFGRASPEGDCAYVTATKD